MNIIPFIIAAMFLVQFSMYAQSTGQVTLSIKLYPIQTIEVAPIETQTLEISSEDALNAFNQTSPPNCLATFSTCQFALKVDSVKSTAFEQLRASSAVPPSRNRSINNIIDAERYNYETDGDDLQVVYCMETI